MAINPANFATLKQAFAEAEKQGVLLYDIMTERSEITTMLQKEISQAPALFGELEKGTPEKPAVEKVSVHHFFKEVAGKPLIRPAWFFDVRQQGEGLVDVTTHLVDLVQWEVFPNVTLSPSDAKVLSARRWATAVTPAEFERSTGAKEFPAYLKRDVDDKGVLQVFSNGEMIYTLRGVHAKVSVTWNFEPPAGTKDTHYSIMRGTKANAVIRQGPEQKYKPMLYIEKVGDASDAEFEATLKSTVDGWQKEFPGVAFVRDGAAWRFEIPAVYDVGHEAHFAQVTRRYLDYLKAGKLPAWEVPNMITKYATIMQAYELCRPK
jgi:predicted dehydrogenase